jgi:hypothetical protein
MRVLNIVVAIMMALPSFSMEIERYSVTSSKPCSKKVIRSKDFRNGIRSLISENAFIDLENFLIEKDKEVNLKQSLNIVSGSELPLLHWALTREGLFYDIYEALIKYGADPNLVIKENVYIGVSLYQGYNAAHIAVCMFQSVKVLNLLCDYETNFLHEDAGGWTPLRVADRLGNQSAIKFIRGNVDLTPPGFFDESDSAEQELLSETCQAIKTLATTDSGFAEYPAESGWVTSLARGLQESDDDSECEMIQCGFFHTTTTFTLLFILYFGYLCM